MFLSHRCLSLYLPFPEINGGKKIFFLMEVIPGQHKGQVFYIQMSLCGQPLYADHVNNITTFLTYYQDNKERLPRVFGRWLRIQETHQQRFPSD